MLQGVHPFSPGAQLLPSPCHCMQHEQISVLETGNKLSNHQQGIMPGRGDCRTENGPAIRRLLTVMAHSCSIADSS